MAAKDNKQIVTVSVSMTQEDKKAIKYLALDNDMTVSGMIQKWLHAELEKQNAKK